MVFQPLLMGGWGWGGGGSGGGDRGGAGRRFSGDPFASGDGHFLFFFLREGGWVGGWVGRVGVGGKMGRGVGWGLLRCSFLLVALDVKKKRKKQKLKKKNEKNGQIHISKRPLKLPLKLPLKRPLKLPLIRPLKRPLKRRVPAPSGRLGSRTTLICIIIAVPSFT